MPNDDYTDVIAAGLAASKPRRTYDRYQDDDADWSLDRIGELQTAFTAKFGKPLPLSNKGQSSYHVKQGLDHRASADIALNPTTPEGQWTMTEMRARKMPFLAFDRAHPGVSSGPHIHGGRPSSRTATKYSVGAQVKSAAKKPKAEYDDVVKAALTDDYTDVVAAAASKKRSVFDAATSGGGAGYEPPPQSSVPNIRDILTEATTALHPPAQPAPRSSFAGAQAGARSAKRAGVGELREIDDPQVSRIQRITRDVAATVNQASDAETQLLREVNQPTEVIRRLTLENQAEVWNKANESAIAAQTQTYRNAIQASRSLPGQDPNKWLAEMTARGGAGIAEFLAGMPGSQEGTDLLRVHAEAMARAAELEGADRNAVSKFTQEIAGGLIATAPEMGMMAAGIPPVGAFGVGGGVRAAGRGEDIHAGTLHGGATGAAFMFPGVGRGLAKVASHAGVVGAGTTAVELAAGASVHDALRTGATNALIAGGPGAIRSISRFTTAAERALKTPEPTVPPDLQSRLTARDITDAGGEVLSTGTKPRFRVSDEQLARMTEEATNAPTVLPRTTAPTPDVSTPLSPPEVVDLTGMGSAITENLYRGMFDRMQQGKLPAPFPAEAQPAFERRAKAEFDAGRIQKWEDLRDLATKPEVTNARVKPAETSVREGEWLPPHMDALRRAAQSIEGLKDLSPPPEGRTRLYRGESETQRARETFTDVGARERPEELTGRWFTTSPTGVVPFIGEKGGRVRYVDVPTGELKRYADAIPEHLKTFGHDEYVLPPEVIATGKEFIPAAQPKPTEPTPAKRSLADLMRDRKSEAGSVPFSDIVDDFSQGVERARERLPDRELSAPHHAVLQPRTQTGQFDGPPVTGREADLAADRALVRTAAKEYTRDYSALDKHPARRQGLDIANDDIATNYFTQLRRFAATHKPEALATVDQAERLFSQGKYAEATRLADSALGGTHEYLGSLTEADSALGLLELGEIPASTRWRQAFVKVRQNMARTGGLSSGGSVIYDVNKYPEGGRADHEKLALWLEPVIEELRVELQRVKSSDRLQHIRTRITEMLTDPLFTDWHPLNKSAVYGVVAGKLREGEPPVAQTTEAPRQKERSRPKTLERSGRDPGTDVTYEEAPNKATIARVEKRLATEGPEALEAWYRDAPPSADRTDASRQLVDHYQTEAVKLADSDPTTAAALRERSVELSNIENVRSTSMGQAIQANAILEKYTPAGVTKEIAKAAQRGATVPADIQQTVLAAAVEHQKADTQVKKARTKVTTLEEKQEAAVAKATGEGKGEFEPVAKTTYRRTTGEPSKPPKNLKAMLKEMAPNEQLREAASRMIGETTLSQWMRETRTKYKLTTDEAAKLGNQAQALLRKARAAVTEESRMAALRRKYPDATTPELIQARTELEAAIKRRREAKLKMAHFFDSLDRKQQGFYRRSMNITRALMVSAVSTAMRNLQSQLGRYQIERLTDLTEHVMRRTVGMDSDFTARDIMRNSFRAFRPSEGQARDVLGEHPAELSRMFNVYAGGVEVHIPNRAARGVERVFGTLERGAEYANFANRLQEFHLRSAEFLAELDLHLKKEKGMSLEQFVKREGADKIPTKLIEKAVDKALEVTFAASPGKDGAGGRLLNSMIEVGNYFPPTMSPAAFPRFMFNNLKFLYQYNPTGLIDLARKNQNRPRVISRALVGTSMLLLGYQFRNSDHAGEKWYELKIGGHTLDARPFGPFSTYLFFGELIRRAVNGEKAFKPREIAEAFGASTTPGGVGSDLVARLYEHTAGFVTAWLSGGDVEGTFNKLQRIAKTEGGEFGRALLTPVRQVKDLIAGFDSFVPGLAKEGYTRDTSDAPFTGAIRESIPFASRGLPTANRPTSTTPIHQEYPAVKALTGWRVQTPKTFLESQLDELHFDFSEIRSNTGNSRVDSIEKRLMGPTMDRLSDELSHDEPFKKASPAKRAVLLKEKLQDVREEVRELGEEEDPAAYEELREQRKPAREKALEREESNSPGLSRALQLGVPLPVPQKRSTEDDLAYRARLIQTSRKQKAALDAVVARNAFHAATQTEQRNRLHEAVSV